MSIFKFLYKHRDLSFIPKNWFFTESRLQLKDKQYSYLIIEDSRIDCFGVDMLVKQKGNSEREWNIFDQYFRLLHDMEASITKINHIGFGYLLPDYDSEITMFKKNLSSEFELVEEDSGDVSHNRWFFIRHKTDRSLTKIELVLYSTQKYRDFCPQFQIDIDTTLSFESIKIATDKLFGKDFFFWKYDVPRYGVVMAMGKLGVMNGVNVLLGLGTNLRKPQTFKDDV